MAFQAPKHERLIEVSYLGISLYFDRNNGYQHNKVDLGNAYSGLWETPEHPCPRRVAYNGWVKEGIIERMRFQFMAKDILGQDITLKTHAAREALISASRLTRLIQAATHIESPVDVEAVKAALQAFVLSNPQAYQDRSDISMLLRPNAVPAIVIESAQEPSAARRGTGIFGPVARTQDEKDQMQAAAEHGASGAVAELQPGESVPEVEMQDLPAEQHTQTAQQLGKAN